MNEVHKILLNNLKKLINCIEGEYFISDGALLGHVRENKLIEYDDDIDIYLLPNSYINKDKLKLYDLDIQKYYICDKIYSKNHTKIKKNKWFEYIDYMRTKRDTENFNRAELFEYASKTYNEDSIDPKFSYPYIDIFYLKENDDEYYLPYKMSSNYANKYLYFKKDIINPIMKTMFCDIKDVCIPYDSVRVIKNIYGDDWFIPKKFNNK